MLTNVWQNIARRYMVPYFHLRHQRSIFLENTDVGYVMPPRCGGNLLAEIKHAAEPQQPLQSKNNPLELCFQDEKNGSELLSVGSDELAEGSCPTQQDEEDEEDDGIGSREEADDVVEEEEEDFEAALDEDYVVPSDDPADSDYKPGDDQDSGIELEIPGPLHDFPNYDGFDRTNTTRRRRWDKAKAIRKEKRDKNWADLAFRGCMASAQYIYFRCIIGLMIHCSRL